MPTNPTPVLPRYGNGSLVDVMPWVLRGALGPAGAAIDVPDWMVPHDTTVERRVVLLIDGLGWNQLRERASLAPTLSALAGSVITSVAPTTTATALTSLSTGTCPGEHGIVGYRMDMGSSVMNTLRWGDERGDLRRVHAPSDVQPCPPFMGVRVPVVSKAELEDTGFTAAHLRGSLPAGWRVASSIPVIVSDLLSQGEPLVYAYYDGLDKVAHERGFGAYYDAEIRACDRLVSDLIAALPSGTALYVTADHGQVQVGDNTITLPPQVMRMVRRQSGEGRFRWLHAVSGAERDLLDTCNDLFGDLAWVVSRQRIIDESWFGPVVRPPALRRLGDVALVPFADVSFDDPADGGHFVLQCRHGSMTAAEVEVPLLVHVV
ncbi:MAG: alkaline phosphatase family protein [Acidobacteria bacterium]|nr:alkaline phosphatase family protein [Acidobacteriota bacterium]